jgi:hypothetical protein
MLLTGGQPTMAVRSPDQLEETLPRPGQDFGPSAGCAIRVNARALRGDVSHAEEVSLPECPACPACSPPTAALGMLYSAVSMRVMDAHQPQVDNCQPEKILSTSPQQLPFG